MKCPHCDKEIDVINTRMYDYDYSMFWFSDSMRIVRKIKCPHCNNRFFLKEDYGLESRRIFNPGESE